MISKGGLVIVPMRVEMYMQVTCTAASYWKSWVVRGRFQVECID